LSTENAKHRGFLLIEIIVAISLLGVLILAFTLSLNGFARFNRVQLVKQQCTAAAQAQFDSMAITGKPIPDEDFQRLWPKLNVSIKQTDGTGQWQGLNLVEVEASGMAFSQPVQVSLFRYMVIKSPPIEREL
jgi:prepilin-type N-terminal cleavage/methylation domain-containing protein